MNFGDDYIEVNPYKYDAEMPKEPPKYRLIDILNKIANGELKEGTKVIIDELEYIYRKGLEDTYILFKNGWEIGNYDIFQMINKEVELIEPEHFPDAGKVSEHFREDTKMIEELDGYEANLMNIFFKLNEVIRIINKRVLDEEE